MDTTNSLLVKSSKCLDERARQIHVGAKVEVGNEGRGFRKFRDEMLLPSNESCLNCLNALSARG